MPQYGGEAMGRYVETPMDTIDQQRQALSPQGAEQAKSQYAQAKEAERVANVDVHVPSSGALRQFSRNPEVQKYIVDQLVAMGVVDPKTGMGKNGQIMKAVETLAKQDDL